jgi:hypothetical protein
VQPPRKDAFKADFQAHSYTAFDVWCGKASPKTFGQITDEDVFDKLLLHCRAYPEVYESKKSASVQNATRNMNPATGVHQAHWEPFIKGEELDEGKKAIERI